ncbi:MAG: response regulator transcription factor [Thermoleophilia bacterium]|nr:response regulator transcription factor [Thermoleophilia bacterium]
MPSTSVLVADDHPLFRETLAHTVRTSPDLALVAECADGGAALERIRALRPQVAVIDRALPGLHGDEVLAKVVEEALPTRVLIISGSFAAEEVYEVLAAGAAGFVSKNVERAVVLEAIRAVGRGETALSPDIQGQLAARIRAMPRDTGGLTDREVEVLALVAEGLSAAAIGRRMHLSEATIKTHLHRLYEKLGVSERAAAVAEAMRRGIIR